MGKKSTKRKRSTFAKRPGVVPGHGALLNRCGCRNCRFPVG